jgi:hypothetical protein
MMLLHKNKDETHTWIPIETIASYIVSNSWHLIHATIKGVPWMQILYFTAPAVGVTNMWVSHAPGPHASDTYCMYSTTN